MKKGPYGKFAVDVEDGFEPYYVVNPDKKKTVTELKRKLKEADALYLATDGDREGEAIAWHLKEVLKPKVPVYRMTFPEITREAVHPCPRTTLRDIDLHLVDAQETRRILDRIVRLRDFRPVLWRKVRRGLSAGRVQSVATRLVVERERERMAFVSADYWGVEATCSGRPVRRGRARCPSGGAPPTATARRPWTGGRVATGTRLHRRRPAAPSRRQGLRRPPARGRRPRARGRRAMRSAAPRVRSASRTSPTSAARPPPSPPPPSSRRPPASCA